MKTIKMIQKSLCVLMIVIWGFLLFGFFSVPNEIVAVTDAGER